MNVSRDVIADHWEVEEEDVKCDNCEYWSKDFFGYCIYWDLYGDIAEGFCAFWSPKGGTK